MSRQDKFCRFVCAVQAQTNPLPVLNGHPFAEIPPSRPKKSKQSTFTRSSANGNWPRTPFMQYTGPLLSLRHSALTDRPLSLLMAIDSAKVSAPSKRNPSGYYDEPDLAWSETKPPSYLLMPIQSTRMVGLSKENSALEEFYRSKRSPWPPETNHRAPKTGPSPSPAARAEDAHPASGEDMVLPTCYQIPSSPRRCR